MKAVSYYSSPIGAQLISLLVRDFHSLVVRSAGCISTATPCLKTISPPSHPEMVIKTTPKPESARGIVWLSLTMLEPLVVRR